MATDDVWQGGDGNWNTGTLWSLGAPPTSSEVAYFDTSPTQTITYDLTSSIAGLYANVTATTIDLQGGVLSTANTETSYVGGQDQTFLGLIDQTGGTLAITGGVQYIASLIQTAGALVVGAGAELLTGGTTIDGALSGGGAYFLNNGAATIGAGASVSVGTLALNGSTTLDLGGNLGYGGQLSGASATLVLGGHRLTESGRVALSGGVIDGPGEVVLDGNGSLYGVTVTGTVTVLDSGLVVEAGNMLLGAAGADSVTLSVLPGGVFDVLDNSLIDSNDTTSLISNAGVFEKAAANNTSNIEVPFTQGAGGTLVVQRGVLEFTAGGSLAGLITGAGALQLSSLNYTLAAGTTIDVASLIVASAATTYLQGNLTYDGAFTLGNSALELDGYTLTLGGTSLFVPYSGVYGGGTLAVGAAGSATIDYLVLVDGADLVDQGLVTQSGQFFFLAYQSGSDTGTLDVANGGTYDLLAGEPIYEQGAAAIVNSGLFEQVAGSGNSVIYPSFTQTSTGTLWIQQGSMQLNGGGTLAGLIGGDGQLYLTGASLVLQSGVSVDVATFVLANSVVTVGGPLTYGGDFILGSGTTIDAAGTTLTLAGSSLLPGYVVGGTIAVTGTAVLNDGVEFAGGSELLDEGLIYQNGNVYIGYPVGTFAGAASLLVTSGGTYDLFAGTGINYSGTSTVTNQGLFENTGAGSGSAIYSSFTQTSGGTLLVTHDVLELYGGGSLAGQISGGGELALGSGTFALASGVSITIANWALAGSSVTTLNSSLAYDGNFTLGGAATLDAVGTTLTLAGPSLLQGYVIGGTIAVTGTAVVNDGVYFGGGSELLDENVIVQNQNINIGQPIGTFDGTATLVVVNGATYDLFAGSSITQGGTGPVLNRGLFEDTGAGGTSVIQPSFTQSSTGTLLVQRDALELSGGGSLAGQIGGGGELILGNGNFALASGIAIDVASLDLTTGGVTTLNGPLTYNGNFALGGSTTLIATGTTLTLTGPTSLAGIVAGGTLAVTGTAAFTNNLQLDGGAELLDDGVVIQSAGDGLNLGKSFGTLAATGTVLVANGATYKLAGSNITQSGTGGGVINQGLFEVTGAATTSNISSNFQQTSTGTLLVARGGLNLTGTLTNDGLVKVAGVATLGTVTADAGHSGTIELLAGGDVVLANTTPGSVLVTGQTIAFAGSSAELLIGSGQLPAFDTPITGFAQGDTIVLDAVQANSFTYSGGTLTLDYIFNGSTTAVGTLDLPGISSPGSLALYADPTYNGTDIVFGPNAPGFSWPTATPTGDTWLGGSGSWNTGTLWSTGSPPGPSNTAILPLSTAYTVTYDTTDTVGQLEVDGGTLAITGGTLTVNQGAPYSSSNSNGTILQTGGLLQLPNGFDFGGPYTLAAGATLEVDYGVATIAGTGSVLDGVLTGNGEVELNAPGTITLAGTMSVASFYVASGTAALGQSLTYGGAFYLDSTLLLNGDTLTLSGSAQLDSTIVGPGTVAVTGSADLYTALVDGGAVLLDRGVLTQSNYIYLANLGGTDTATLEVANGATYDILVDNAINQTGTGAVFNSGLFEKTAGFGTSIINPGFTQAGTGTLLVARGVVDLNGGGSLGGTLAGAGELVFNAGAFSLQSGAVLDVATLAIETATTIASNLTYDGSFDLTSALVLNGNTLTLDGPSQLDGLIAGGTVVVNGSADLYGLFVEDGGVLLDQGTLTQSNYIYVSETGAADTGTLVVAAGATYDILVDNNVDQTGTGAVFNSGLFEKTAGIGLSIIVPSFTQAGTGTLLVANGVVQLNGGGSLGGVIDGAGELLLDGGAFTLQPGVSLDVATVAIETATTVDSSHTYDGTFDLTSALALNGNTLTLDGPSQLDGQIVGGTVVVNGSADLYALFVEDGGVLVDQGILTQSNYIYLSETGGTDSGTLVVAAGATYDILADSNINATGTGAILNDGLFEKTAGIGGSAIVPSFTQAGTGTLLVARGVVALDGGGTLGGLIAGAGELVYNIGAYTLQPGVSLDRRLSTPCRRPSRSRPHRRRRRSSPRPQHRPNLARIRDDRAGKMTGGALGSGSTVGPCRTRIGSLSGRA